MTGRQLISSALRLVNAIGQNETPEYGMFENARSTLNLLLGSWSAEKLMPHHYVKHSIPLFANVPNYTIDSGDDFDSDSICLSQSPAAGGTQSLSIDGTYASGGVATLDVPRHILIASTADDSGRTFVVTGTTEYGDTITETITGPDTATTRGFRRFKTVTSVTIDGNSAGNITVGSDYIINMRRPAQVMYAYLRDSTGIDSPVKVINKQRYDEIEDKDESGNPTRIYYDKSTPAGEIYVHPVPSTGVVLANNSGVEHIANGSFASAAKWTLGTAWSISGGKLVRTGGGTVEYLADPDITVQADWAHLPGAAGWWSFSNPGWSYTNNGFTGGNNRVYTDQFVSSKLQPSTEYQFNIIASGHANDINGLASRISLLIYSDGGEQLTTLSIGVADININSTFNITTPANLVDSNQRIGIDLYGFDYSSFNITKVSVTTATPGTTASQKAADLASPLVNGDKYTVSFDVSDYSAGTCKPVVGNTSGPSVGWNGSNEFEITAGAGTDFELTSDGDFTAKIDNVSVINLPYSTLTPQDYTLHMDLWMPFVTITADNEDDEISLPGEYLLALRWNLAAELAPEYGNNPSPYILIRSEETKNVIKMLNGLIPKHANLGKPLPQIGRQIAVSQL